MERAAAEERLVEGLLVQITVAMGSISAEADDSLRQMVLAFRPMLGSLGEKVPACAAFGHLSLRVNAMHPAGSTPYLKGKARSSGATCEAQAQIDYIAWAAGDWSRRSDEFARTLSRAVEAIHKTRISEEERSRLLQLMDEARIKVRSDPLSPVAELRPVYLVYEHGSIESPRVCFTGPPSDIPPGGRLVVVEPSDAVQYARQPVTRADPPEMFKLYRRIIGNLHYREAWADGERIVEHRGACGDGGETRDHPIQGQDEAKRCLARLKAEALADGFRPIPPSRHAALVVAGAVDGVGTPEDLEHRHALEEFLNERTGWLGLGHCDGGSIGSGSMEAVCYVVDFDAAREALARELCGSRFQGFSISRER